ncbi:MAG: hypothetical protein R2797_00385 [Gelidibacter sp.]
MKHSNILLVAFSLFLFTFSCSKDDNKDDDQTAEPEFSASINGGTFSDYHATLGFYNATSGASANSLNITITDSNNNIINIFLNGTGGLNSGVIKEMNNVDSEGFVTNLVIRDQAAQVTYTSTSGSITISENREGPSDSGYRYISGDINVTTSTNTGTEVTITGSFTDFKY